MKSGACAAVALLLATGAFAAPPASDGGTEAERAAVAESAAAPAETATPSETAAVPAEAKKICRTEKATGSLTRRNRICMTQAQWREIYDRTRRGVGELQGSASGAPACMSAMDVACGAPSGM